MIRCARLSPPKPSGKTEMREAATMTTSRCTSWLRGGDLNPRPLGYEPNELPDCSTPRHVVSGTDRTSTYLRPERQLRERSTVSRAPTHVQGSPAKRLLVYSSVVVNW